MVIDYGEAEHRRGLPGRDDDERRHLDFGGIARNQIHHHAAAWRRANRQCAGYHPVPFPDRRRHVQSESGSLVVKQGERCRAGAKAIRESGNSNLARAAEQMVVIYRDTKGGVGGAGRNDDGGRHNDRGWEG